MLDYEIKRESSIGDTSEILSPTGVKADCFFSPRGSDGARLASEELDSPSFQVHNAVNDEDKIARPTYRMKFSRRDLSNVPGPVDLAEGCPSNDQSTTSFNNEISSRGVSIDGDHSILR